MESISKMKLPNSLCIKITDHSRLIATDRWYVKIICSVTMPVSDRHFIQPHEEDSELAILIRKYLGSELEMELVQERNFVDAEIKDEVCLELQDRLSENITGYLALESFPERFFAVKYEEAKKICILEMANGIDNQEDEPDEPVDFSACFQD